MADLQIDNITKRYGSSPPALHAISLSVQKGELMAIVGPSGSGKSTLLRIIAGLETPDAGDVRIAGRSCNRLPPHKRGIAMVFQSYTLYPHMTIERNLLFSARDPSATRAEINQRLRTAAAVLSIDHLLARYPGELSGGERQRAALAKAMVRQPHIFLFDEPLSNLDIQLRHQARAEIKALHRRLNTTTIHVTHDQEEAMVLGDRIAILDRGLLQQVGAPEDLYRRPANRFVAGFVGSPPMNFIKGTIEPPQQTPDSPSESTFTFTELAPANPFRATLSRTHLPQLALSEPTPRELTLGIRPQSIQLFTSEPPPDTLSLDLTITLIQPLGDAIDLHCTLPSGNHILIRQSASSSFKTGDHIRALLPLRHLHFFAPGPHGASLAQPHSP